MYYFYNRGLEAVLSQEGWVNLEQLKQQNYHLILLKSTVATGIFQKNLSTTLKNNGALYLCLLMEKRLPNKKPTSCTLTQKERNKISSGEKALLHYLLNEEKSQIELRDSAIRFPIQKEKRQNPPKKPAPQTVSPEKSETKLQEDFVDNLRQELAEKLRVELEAQIREEVEAELVEGLKTAQPEVKEVLQFQPDQIAEKVLKEEKYLSLKSQLKVKNYKFAQDIQLINETMERVFRQTEEISNSYGDLLNQVDAQIEDELHYIEFSKLEPEIAIKTFQNLQDLRLKRRFLKDSMYMAELMRKTGGIEFASRMQETTERIQDLDKRTYLLRAPEDFSH